MNGVFTEAESSHLTSEERMHYLAVGLCAPATYADLERFVADEKDKAADIQDQLDEANEAAGALQAELDEVREAVGRLQLKAATLTESQLREELAELLD